MRQVTFNKLKDWHIEGHQYLLLDVRDAWERELFNIGGLHIPMEDLAQRANEIPRDTDVVVYCEKGIRSVIVIQRLEGAGFNNLVNLAGGIKSLRNEEQSNSDEQEGA